MIPQEFPQHDEEETGGAEAQQQRQLPAVARDEEGQDGGGEHDLLFYGASDRKSTRLNSSH